MSIWTLWIGFVLHYFALLLILLCSVDQREMEMFKYWIWFIINFIVTRHLRAIILVVAGFYRPDLVLVAVVVAIAVDFAAVKSPGWQQQQGP